MTKIIESTPLPWEASLVGSNYPRVHAGDKIVADVVFRSRGEAIANVELIVRAVNSHAALVEALEDAIFMFDEMGLEAPTNWQDAFTLAKGA